MKNYDLKKSSVLFIMLLFIFSIASPINTYANSNDVILNISKDANDVPLEIVQQIVEENRDASSIRILEYGEIKDIGNSPEQMENFDTESIPEYGTSLMFKYKNIKTYKTVKYKNQVAKDEFKFSVAKGETVSLKTEYTGVLKGKISGQYFKKSNIGAEITIKGKYSKGTKYSGPPESSKYNAREYRMKFYQEVGTYKQVADKVTYYGLHIEKTEKVSKTGSYKKPTKYVSYSIDKKVR